MFRFMSPRYAKGGGSKKFPFAPLTKLYPHLQNRGAAPVWDYLYLYFSLYSFYSPEHQHIGVMH